MWKVEKTEFAEDASADSRNRILAHIENEYALRRPLVSFAKSEEAAQPGGLLTGDDVREMLE